MSGDGGYSFGPGMAKVWYGAGWSDGMLRYQQHGEEADEDGNNMHDLDRRCIAIGLVRPIFEQATSLLLLTYPTIPMSYTSSSDPLHTTSHLSLLEVPQNGTLSPVPLPHKFNLHSSSQKHRKTQEHDCTARPRHPSKLSRHRLKTM